MLPCGRGHSHASPDCGFLSPDGAPARSTAPPGTARILAALSAVTTETSGARHALWDEDGDVSDARSHCAGSMRLSRARARQHLSPQPGASWDTACKTLHPAVSLFSSPKPSSFFTQICSLWQQQPGPPLFIFNPLIPKVFHHFHGGHFLVQ